MGSNRSPKDEIRSLTGLRGVAALLVVLYHAFHRGTPYGAVLERGYLSVDLFFVLSGFVMALNYGNLFNGVPFSPRNYIKFLALRFSRLYPVYVLLLCVVLGLNAAGLMPLFDVPDVATALPWNLTMMQALSFGAGNINLPAWSISTEWVAYLLFAILVAVCLSRSEGVYWSAAVAAILGLFAVALLAPALQRPQLEIEGPLSIFSTETALPVLRCVAGFMLGLVCYRIQFERQGNWLGARPVVGDIAAALICACLLVPYTDILFVIGSALLIAHLGRGRSATSDFLGTPWVHWLGMISYSLYLVHIPLILSLRTIVRHYDLPYTVANVTGVVLSLLVAPLTYRYVEVPGRLLLRSLIRSSAMGFSRI